MIQKIKNFFEIKVSNVPITSTILRQRFLIGLPMAVLIWFVLFLSNIGLSDSPIEFPDSFSKRVNRKLLQTSFYLFIHFLVWVIYHKVVYRKEVESKSKLIFSLVLNSFMLETVLYLLFYYVMSIIANMLGTKLIWVEIFTTPETYILLLPLLIGSLITFWSTNNSHYFFKLRSSIKQSNSPLTDSYQISTHRIALIIGNDKYEHYDYLKKQPINDANAIEERLKSMGAEVIKHTNLSYEGIRRAILDFRQKAKGYDDVTFFYAGHGLSYNGKNYLVPTDATPPTTEAELEDLMYAYEQVVKHFADMDGRWNHFFIDACRHTLQFEDRGKPKPMTIGDKEKKELEKWKKRNGKNVCIFFGAAEGEAAYNNRYGNNGIFTTALLKYLIKGITLDDLIKQVTEETQQISGYKQLPYVTATVSGTYVF